MNAKKTIIFSVNESNQIYSEFTCNTTITFLKSYFRDVTGISEFSFVFNGKNINNDTLQIRNLLNKNSTSKTLIIQVVVNSETTNKGVVLKTNHDSQRVNYHLPESAMEIMEDNELLKKKDKDNSYKIRGLTDEYNSLKKERDALNKKIEEMADDRKEIEEKVAVARLMMNSLTEENRELKQMNDTLVKENEELLSINDLKKIALVRTGDRFTLNNNCNKECINNATIYNKEQKDEIVRTDSDTKEHNKKEELFQPQPQLSLKEERSKSILFITNKSIEENVLQPKIEKPMKKYQIESIYWKYISTYLTLEEQNNYSLTSKHNWHLTYNMRLEELSSNLLWLESDLKQKIDQYTLLFKDKNQFTISKFSKSALMVLNNNSHSQLFSEDQITLFKGEMQICMYQLLFQLTKVQLDTLDMSPDDFANKLIVIFKEGITLHKGLGEYLKFCLQNVDFSFANILCAYDIMKTHQITSINSSDISKDNKTSGIISFLVKDILIYCGIEEDSKLNSNLERYNTFKVIQNTIKTNDNQKRAQDHLLQIIKSNGTFY